MSNVEKKTVSLPPRHVAYIDKMVASGSYASASEVVRAGLRALQERDEAVEKWLIEEVAASYDANKDDPSLGLNADSVFSEVRARHAKQLKGDE
ncbi:MAG: type II toxin-antitoxin system ParD family antitoxin [Alphaproteobacteria bacterium]